MCTISWSDNVEKAYLGIGGAIMLECVGEEEYEYSLDIRYSRRSKMVRFCKYGNNSEVLTAVLLKTEGFLV
jgi:hypothetical protein